MYLVSSGGDLVSIYLYHSNFIGCTSKCRQIQFYLNSLIQKLFYVFLYNVRSIIIIKEYYILKNNKYINLTTNVDIFF
jgi:hypothetical protein